MDRSDLLSFPSNPQPATILPVIGTKSRPAFLDLDMQYFTTVSGILKVDEIIVGFICSIVYGQAYFSGNPFFLFVSLTCMVITVFLLVGNLVKVPKFVAQTNLWSLVECVYGVTAAVCYAVAASVPVARTSLPSGDPNVLVFMNSDGSIYSATFVRFTVAGMIAFLAFFLYSADALVHYRSYRTKQEWKPLLVVPLEFNTL